MFDGPQRVCDVPIDHLHFVWPQVRHYIDAALKRGAGGRYELPDVLDALLRGKARLWASWDAESQKFDAAIITETIQYPRLKELHLWLVGGEGRRHWYDEAEAMITAFARADGCSVVASGGRRGWLRGLSDEWRETGATWEKRL